MSRGRFITFEGGEGAGKSTQLSLLIAALEARGIKTLKTREPGGSPGAEDIRRLLVEGEVNRWEPLSETLLHLAARYDHVSRIIKPALESGTWVICDRFSDSTIAYQGAGQNVGVDKVKALSDLVIGDLAPDLTLILDINVEAGLRRAIERTNGESGDHQRYERMDLSFHERLRACFIEMAKTSPQRCVLIDATGLVADVHKMILDQVRSKFHLTQ